MTDDQQPVGEHPDLAGCDCHTWASKSVIYPVARMDAAAERIAELEDAIDALTTERDAAVNDADQLRADITALTIRVDNLHRRFA